MFRKPRLGQTKIEFTMTDDLTPLRLVLGYPIKWWFDSYPVSLYKLWAYIKFRNAYRKPGRYRISIFYGQTLKTSYKIQRIG